MSRPVEDLAGRIFGRLTVVGFDHSQPVKRGTRSYWRCRCSCGVEKVIRSDGLKCGDNVSCGCKKVEQLTTHGDTGSAEHEAWLALFDRCRNPNNEAFKDYGGRGIDICSRWEKYENFLTDMGRRPTDKHTLERELNDEGYQPDNCLWATRREQSYNRRSTKLTLQKAAEIRARSSENRSDLAREYGVDVSMISRVLTGDAWSEF